jgi:hypothetical protein
MQDTGLWAAPLLLIPGVGLLILSTAARFSQLHQELHRQLTEGKPAALHHLCKRAHLLHRALFSFYLSITILAISSLLGTLVLRWSESLRWLPESLTFFGVVVISYAAFQLVRESRLLITVILDAAESAGDSC